MFSNLYIQHGAWIPDPEIKSHMLLWLSQPGSPKVFIIFIKSNYIPNPRSYSWEELYCFAFLQISLRSGLVEDD